MRRALSSDILSGVRGSWGAMLACFIMFGFCLYILGGKAKRKFKLFAVIFAVCVVGASAAVLSSPTAMYKFLQIGIVSEANLENESMRERIAGAGFSSGRDLILKAWIRQGAVRRIFARRGGQRRADLNDADEAKRRAVLV